MTAEELIDRLRAQESELARRAMHLLRQPDLVPYRDRGTRWSRVRDLKRIYTSKLDLLPVTGLQQEGLEELVATLTALPDDQQLCATGFQTAESIAVFWTDKAEELVAILLLKRRTAEAEELRKEQFERELGPLRPV